MPDVLAVGVVTRSLLATKAIESLPRIVNRGYVENTILEDAAHAPVGMDTVAFLENRICACIVLGATVANLTVLLVVFA